MAKMHDTEELSRLPREEQQKLLGGQPSQQPFGVDPGGGQTVPPQVTRPKGPGGRERGTGDQPQRTLDPEEVARRKQAKEGGGAQAEFKGGPDDPLRQEQAGRAMPRHVQQAFKDPDGGPTEGFARRLERAAAAVGPSAIDYDRDGYPDAVVGRSGRNYNQHLRHMNRGPGPGGQAMPMAVDRNRDGFGDSFTLGLDGHRQDQIGYRDRLRTRREIAAQMGLVGPSAAKDLPVEPRLLAMARTGVPSHGSTGIPGGLPARSVSNPGDAPVPEGAAVGYTPLEQAIMAPRTPHTGRENRGAQLTAQYGGAFQTSNQGPVRSDVGGTPTQGTRQPDGSFLVSSPQGGEVAEDLDAANQPRDDSGQQALAEDEPNPKSPDPKAGPAGTPRAHAQTPIPPQARKDPQATSPATPPAQQARPPAQGQPRPQPPRRPEDQAKK